MAEPISCAGVRACACACVRGEGVTVRHQPRERADGIKLAKSLSFSDSEFESSTLDIITLLHIANNHANTPVLTTMLTHPC